MRKILTFLVGMWMLASLQAQSLQPKREFRGAWIQAVNGQFRGMPTEQMQRMLIAQLNNLQEAGLKSTI